MALPSNISYGTVVGRFLLAYADSSDVDLYPDGIPAKGSVFFTPSPANLKDVSATPAPVTILPSRVEAVLDADGYLCGYTGDQGIRLVATDDADLNPLNWTWLAEFRLTDENDASVLLSPFSFSLPGGTEVDLAVLAPVPDANGTYYLVGPTGPANELTVSGTTTGAPGTDASVVISGTAPTQSLAFTIPEGIQGEQGVQGIQGEAATATAGITTTGAPGTDASVTNVGTVNDAVFDFVVPEGIQGIQGIQGVQGIQGEQGPIGETGATGLNWQGEWSALADYVNDDAVYYNNSSWFASGDPTVGEVPSITATHWYPLALQGATGLTGATGPANELTVGTVTTGLPTDPAEVTITGTAPDQTISFVIPQGEQGIQGIQGPAGDLGTLTADLPVTYTTGVIGFDATQIANISGGTA